MKKVNFGATRPTQEKIEASLDDWITGGREPTKRLTIDVPLSLHKRIKTECARNNQVMADQIRAVLEQRFPASQNTEHSQATRQGVPS